MAPSPHSKSRLRLHYLLQPSTPHADAHQPPPLPSLSDLQRPLSSPPALPPPRALSADSALPYASSLLAAPSPMVLSPPPPAPTLAARAPTPMHSPPRAAFPSGPSFAPTPPPPAPAPRVLDKRELRRMKNRISAARSRQRKSDTFDSLTRELAEAKQVIHALTVQLDQRNEAVVVAVPHDLRQVLGRDYVSVDFLMDVLRGFVSRARASGGADASPGASAVPNSRRAHANFEVS